MLCFIGVGPGDPELMTLKAVRALADADEIALADSGAESAVLKIAGRYLEGKPVLRLKMPMSEQNAEWKIAHEAAARTLLEHLRAGIKIAYPVLGDPSLYATCAYLYPLIAPFFDCRVIPGIPAICAAAAAAGVPLASGREKLTILPGIAENAPLPDGNLVIMKAGRSIAALRKSAAQKNAYIAVNVGMEGERLLPLRDAEDDSYPYFTTVFIKDARQSR